MSSRPHDDEPTVTLRYVGDGIESIPRVGVFQHGTEAQVPRSLAFDLLESDAWMVAERGAPAVQLHLHLGQWDGPDAQRADLARALEPTAPEEFGDLPVDGPPPAPGFAGAAADATDDPLPPRHPDDHRP